MSGTEYGTISESEKSEQELNSTGITEATRSNEMAITTKKRPLTLPLALATASAVLGSSLQFGINTGIINNPKPVIQEFFNETSLHRYGEPMPVDQNEFLFALTVAIFAVGGMVGSLIAGLLGDKFGRKGTLLLNNILAFAAALLMGLSKVAWSYEMLIIGRIVIGINCGINTGIVPMYLSEISPFNLRGGVSVMHQLAITTGILLSQVVGLPIVLGTDDLWPLCLAIVAVPAVIQLILLPFCPESPRYLLINREKEKKATEALTWLRNDAVIADEIAEMKREHADEMKEERISILQLFKLSSLRRPLVISVVLQLSQQLSGITAVLYYSTTIFIVAGVSKEDAQYVTLSTGAIMVLMTIITIPLMDRCGRRILHLSGLGIMCVFAALLTVFLSIGEKWEPSSYFSIACVLVFTMGFALGPGSIPWIIVAELFSQGPRPAAISIAFCVNWTANFAVGLLFPILQNAINEYVFIIFVVLLVVFFVFTYFFLPETKNKSFEEISALFKSKGERGDGNCSKSPNTDSVRYSALDVS